MNKSAIHKLLVLLLIIILPIFILKRHKILRDRSTFASALRVESTVEYSNKHFVIVIPMDSAPLRLEKSLQEIVRQSYHNYHLIFISKEARQEIANTCLKVQKEYREKSLYFPTYEIASSYYGAIHSLENDDIVIHLELENWFSDPKVLEKIAYTFSNPDVWLAYCSYMQVPSYEIKLEHKKPLSRIMQNHTYKQEYLASPIKIFYAGLFKELDIGQDAANLSTFLIPMVKKAKKHIHYISDFLYYHDEKGLRKEEVVISKEH